MQGFFRVSEWKYVVRPVLILAIFWSFAACDSKPNEYVEPPVL